MLIARRIAPQLCCAFPYLEGLVVPGILAAVGGRTSDRGHSEHPAPPRNAGCTQAAPVGARPRLSEAGLGNPSWS
ncbi:hypothetical protein NDU88_003078 [Pleurodeles waltl]|uniref:Uncharacterized protein n=1 Tax=Pleurodeles waltl TaxID=8319 RepID=A0AAV7T435_PLEWA|nr:hypothetical protein NDU88_003078 [Pleurodeles waltl]